MSCITCNIWGFFWCVSTYHPRFGQPDFLRVPTKRADRVDRRRWLEPNVEIACEIRLFQCLGPRFTPPENPTVRP